MGFTEKTMINGLGLLLLLMIIWGQGVKPLNVRSEDGSSGSGNGSGESSGSGSGSYDYDQEETSGDDYAMSRSVVQDSVEYTDADVEQTYADMEKLTTTSDENSGQKDGFGQTEQSTVSGGGSKANQTEDSAISQTGPDSRKEETATAGHAPKGHSKSKHESKEAD